MSFHWWPPQENPQKAVILLSGRYLCEFSQRWSICPAHAQWGQKAEGTVGRGAGDCARPHTCPKPTCSSRLGWRGAAMQLRDRGGDQIKPDGLQSQLCQRQPGQVRPPTVLFTVTKVTKWQKALICPVSCSTRSIRFAVARGKEGIIDFVRGSELKVAKGKRGHLLVVSHQMLWSHVLLRQAGREFCSF